MFQRTSAPHPRRSITVPTLILLSSLLCVVCAAQSTVGWPAYNGGPEADHYSSLKQINRANVQQLKVSWSFDTGEKGGLQDNPLIVGRTLYAYTPTQKVVALDAATGKLKWKFDSGIGGTQPARGVAYWTDGNEERIFAGIMNFMYCLDARTGKPVPEFGEAARLDLRKGLGNDPRSDYQQQSIALTTPGVVYRDLIIVGGRNPEAHPAPPGDIRAFDVHTGKLRWTFHTIPHPGEPGYETWPKDAWKTVGGANAWSGISLDEKRGIVYVPTASPKYNFYGADRTGADLFGDCLLALNARTGKRLWHFQMVHHDIWDYDNATAPKLLTVRHEGKLVDAVAEPGKEGFLWVFNRVTGEPLWPIEERAVPRSDMPGEEAWPTQPFPLKPPPFARQTFTEKDLSSLIEDPAERAHFRDEIQSARNEGIFTPPGLRNTIEMPGNNGGANWGGAAVDPTNGTLY